MSSLKSHEGYCQICGMWRPRLQRDHKVPKFKGVTNDESNIQYLCANCHEDKTALERPEWLIKNHTQETKDKISVANKGHAVSEVTRKKISINARAAMANPELRKRMSEIKKVNPQRYWLGKSIPQEVRDRISKTLKAKIEAQGSHWKGRKHSKETREKISATRKAKRNGFLASV